MSSLSINAAHNLTTSFNTTQSHKPTSLPFFLSARTNSKPGPLKKWVASTRKKRSFSVGSLTDDREVVAEQESPLLSNGAEELAGLQSGSSGSEGNKVGDDLEKLTSSRAINALIVLGFGTFAVSKLLTIDHDYWHVSFLDFDSLLCLL